VTFAEEHDGLFTFAQARVAGSAESSWSDSRTVVGSSGPRGSYQVPYVPQNRFSRCREGYHLGEVPVPPFCDLPFD